MMHQIQSDYEEFLSLDTIVLHHSQLVNNVPESLFHVDMLTAAVTYLLADDNRRLSSHATFVRERIPEYFRWIHGSDVNFKETFAVHCLPILGNISSLASSPDVHTSTSVSSLQNTRGLFLECYAKALSLLRVALMLGDTDWANQETEFLHNIPHMIQRDPQDANSPHFYFAAVKWPAYWEWSQQSAKHSANGLLHKLAVDQIIERLSEIAEVKWNT